MLPRRSVRECGSRVSPEALLSTSLTTTTNHRVYIAAMTEPNANVDRVFVLLQEAKRLETVKDFWKAAFKFVEAQQILRGLANEPALTDEEIRTANLFAIKAQEYWHHSRQCLIKAMEDEKSKDEKAVAGSPDGTPSLEETPPLPEAPGSTASTTQSHVTYVSSAIDEEEASSRNHTFTTLFSKPVVVPMVPTTNKKSQQSTTTAAELEQMSIEERLAELNKSLPSGFKTTDERMHDLNRSMNKLGLSVYPQTKPFARFLDDALPKSEEEQMDEILNQAHDEAALAQRERQEGSHRNSKRKEDSDDDESDEESDKEGDDELLDDDQLAIKNIRKRAGKAQAKITKLISMLDQAQNSKHDNNDEEEENILRGENGGDDDESLDDIPKVPADLFLASGKKHLKGAQKDLQKILKQWDEDLSST